MSSSCFLPVAAIMPAPPSPRMLKRARSSSTDRLSLEQVLKACKRSDPASPHSPVGLTAARCPASASVSASSPVPRVISADVSLDAPATLSPLLQACSSMKSAIPFLQNARRHALSLLLQNECERALHVLEKIERANDMISRQRRRFVLTQANAIHQYNMVHEQQQHTTAQDATAPIPTNPRRVRFSGDVASVDVEAMDRSPSPMPPLIREEILVLRASRPIPVANFSELWN